MLPTLESLYLDFLETFGNLAHPSEEALEMRPDYTNEKIDSIRRLLVGLSSPVSTDPYFYAELWRSTALELATRKIEADSDPFLSAAFARCAELALRTPDLSRSWKEKMESDLRWSVRAAAQCGFELHNRFHLTFGVAADPNLAFFLLQIRAYLQYWEFRYIRDRIATWFGPPENHGWDEYKLGEFWDYSKVHPFLRALCPPGEIWDKYILNGKVCSVDERGTVVERPLDVEELKNDPPKLRWDVSSHPK